MHNIMTFTEAGKFTVKLWTSITANRGWLTKKVESRSKNLNYRLGRKGTKMLVERVSAPVIHTDKKILVSIIEKVQPDMLHGEAEMS